MSLWFLDESGAHRIPLVGKTWAPRGRTPRLLHLFRRGARINIIAAISPKGGVHIQFKPRHGGLNHADVAAFLRHLLRHEPGNIVVFWDGAQQHKGPQIQQVLQDNPRLRIERLPPYAHELNPADGVFNHLKWHAGRNFAPRNTAEHLSLMRRTAQRIRRRHKLVKNWFRNSTLPRNDVDLLAAGPESL